MFCFQFFKSFVWIIEMDLNMMKIFDQFLLAIGNPIFEFDSINRLVPQEILSIKLCIDSVLDENSIKMVNSKKSKILITQK